MNLHSLKWLAAFLYGLLIIRTGLLRGIEAKLYKPNSLWFCAVMGIIAIVAAAMYRLERRKLAATLLLVSASIVLAFYLQCFITKPQGDATIRVGRAMLGSVAMIAIVLMPTKSATE